MIYVTDIKYGWATLNVGYCNFQVSYLTDLVGEIDYLLDLDENKDEIDCKKSYFEGEGQGDLTLISYLTYEDISDDKERQFGYVINIVWQRLFCGEQEGNSFALLKFPYQKLKEEWKNHKKEIKDNYIKNFICPQDEEEYKEALENY